MNRVVQYFGPLETSDEKLAQSKLNEDILNVIKESI
jgi:hypothetical protein